MHNKIDDFFNSGFKTYYGYGFQLRFLSKNDLSSVVRWRNDERIKSKMVNNNSQNLITMIFWYNKLLKDHRTIPFVLENSKGIVGFIELKNFDQYSSNSCEIGYFMAPNLIGNGLILLGLFLIEKVLSDLEIMDLYAVIRNDNLKAIQILKKLRAQLLSIDTEFSTYVSRKNLRISILNKLENKLPHVLRN